MPRVASAVDAAASPVRCRTPRSHPAASASTAANAGAVHRAETLLEEAPHAGRENEYELVVAFVARRWAQEANTSLFVCGGCGCGKTSTVKRALRALSARVLPCDATSRSLVKQSTLAERGWQATATDAGSVDHGTPTCTPRASGQALTETSEDAGGLTPASSVLSSPALRTRSSSGNSLAAALEARLHLSSPESSRPSASSDDSGAGRTRSKRAREDGDGAASCTDDSTRRHRCTSGLFESVAPYSLGYFATRYPEVFASASQGGDGKRASAAASSRQLFAHYVNCADVSGAHLVEAVCDSIKATCSRTDTATCGLLQLLASVGKSATQRSRSSAGEAFAFSSTSPSARRRAASAAPALHVVALDEVEYVRGGGAKALAQLAELSFQHPGQLALIFISNQRAFVHVPQMMLEALLFQPYTEAQLRDIGAGATTAELQRCEEQHGAGTGTGPGRATKARKTVAKTSAAAPAPLRAADVDIKPRLYDFIARKALLEFSGDVRQVIAMCHRVVSVAWQEVTEARRLAAAAAPHATTCATTAAAPRARRAKTAAAAAATTATGTPDLPTKLEAAVQSFSLTKASAAATSVSHPAASLGAATADAAGPASGASSTRSSGAAALAARTAPHSPPPPTPLPQQLSPAAAAAAGSGVMTLAKTVRVLQTNQVESDIDKYVGTLPEQTLYVLSCIVVLTLRRQEERTYAATSVGGRMGSSRAAGAGLTAAQRAAPTLSLKMHEVHHLYTRLMAELHFPAMRADGFQMQVGCLADFGVLTRPQQRGTDVVFSLNGTWTLPAMQAALVKRGEVIKQDRVAAGAGAMMENRFEEVLRELGKLVR